jgi:hypothetical protein
MEKARQLLFAELKPELESQRLTVSRPEDLAEHVLWVRGAEHAQRAVRLGHAVLGALLRVNETIFREYQAIVLGSVGVATDHVPAEELDLGEQVTRQRSLRVARQAEVSSRLGGPWGKLVVAAETYRLLRAAPEGRGLVSLPVRLKGKPGEMRVWVWPGPGPLPQSLPPSEATQRGDLSPPHANE